MTCIKLAAYNKLAEKLNLRPRVDLFIYNDKGQIYAGKNLHRDTLKFPGGGIDAGDSINNSAKREALEEAAIVVGKVHGVGVKPQISLWSDKVRQDMIKSKGRDFDGNKLYFRAAPAHSVDKSILGADNDALKKTKWYNISDALKILDRHGSSNDDFSDWSRLEAESLRNLQRRLQDKK